MAKRAIAADNAKMGTTWLGITLGLGIVFILMQFGAFSQMIAEGYYFTGPTSSITMSYIFLIAVVHILHVVAGLISLLVVLYNQIRGKYSSQEMLGVELGATFWHFLDFLWVYLILFFYFY
jgi:cytochrome c oxidase subunit 3